MANVININNGLLNKKVHAELAELMSSPCKIDPIRARIILDVYRKTEGQPTIIRRASVFEALCAKREIMIDNNPIVGTQTKYKYGGNLFFENGCKWMKRTDKFSLQRGMVYLSEEDRRLIGEAVDYWSDINVFERTKKIISETKGIDIAAMQKCGIGSELTSSALENVLPNFGKVIGKGFNGLIEDIAIEKAGLDTGTSEGIAKLHTYKAMEMSLKAMIALAERYSVLALKMASTEKNKFRKAELLRIADTCKRVPAEPARNFIEALQFLWFIILGIWTENNSVLNSPPTNFTQFMYPYYAAEKNIGTINEAEAIALIQMFFIKINGLAQVMPPHGFAWNQSRLGCHISLGGLTPEGDDATNELDFLVLEAQLQLKLPEPLVNVMYHNKLSDEFLMKSVELIRTGIGQPAFHNLSKAIEMHMNYEDMPLKVARTARIMGCVQPIIPGYSDLPWEGAFSLVKAVELALNNGVDPLSGYQLGPKTGNPDNFKTYDDLFDAVLTQIKYFIPLLRLIMRTAWNVQKESLPVPFSSSLTDDCILNGKDAIEGGARYRAGNGLIYVSGVDAANCLAAVKKLVFEDKKFSMAKLRTAMKADFKGYEEIQKLCMDAPKYGNDDPYVDGICREIFDNCCEEHLKITDYLGKTSPPEAFSVTVHFATGRFTGALPNGRNARVALTDGTVSAAPGTDVNGPTALIRSAAKVLDVGRFATNHFNMKFHPSALKGVDGARKFISMLKTYFDLGGYHAQFNCVSSDTLKKAQLEPDKYKNLVVRVAGFSAFFVHLEKGVQDELINRTELSFK